MKIKFEYDIEDIIRWSKNGLKAKNLLIKLVKEVPIISIGALANISIAIFLIKSKFYLFMEWDFFVCTAIVIIL